MDSLLSQIYRVIEKGYSKLESGEYVETIQRVFVFIGDYPQNDELREIVFDGLDVDNTEIVYIPEFIHIDDSVEIVKTKINEYMYKNEFLLSELYLFYLHKSTIQLDYLYNLLTKHKISIPLDTMKQIIINWSPNDYSKKEFTRFMENIKDEYFLKDLNELFN